MEEEAADAVARDPVEGDNNNGSNGSKGKQGGVSKVLGEDRRRATPMRRCSLGTSATRHLGRTSRTCAVTTATCSTRTSCRRRMAGRKAVGNKHLENLWMIWKNCGICNGEGRQERDQ